MRQKDLGIIFGIIPTSVHHYVTSMRKRVIEKLLHNEHAEIKFPNQEKMRQLAELVRLREPFALIQKHVTILKFDSKSLKKN